MQASVENHSDQLHDANPLAAEKSQGKTQNNFGGAMPAGWDPRELMEILQKKSSESQRRRQQSLVGSAAVKNPPRTKMENRRISARLKSQSVTSEQNTLLEKSDLLIQLAASPMDYILALNLVYEQYLSFGYSQPTDFPIRINNWNLEPISYTFVAKNDDEVVGAVTCIEDETTLRGKFTKNNTREKVQLPSLNSYAEEVSSLRKHKRHFVEVVGLASAETEGKTKIIMELIRAITIFCRRHLRATDWIITVNPRHVRYYQKVMLFRDIGTLRNSKSANGAPGVLMHLDLATMPEQYQNRYAGRTGIRNLHNYFFQTPEEDEDLYRFKGQLVKRNKNWSLIRKSLEPFQSRVG